MISITLKNFTAQSAKEKVLKHRTINKEEIPIPIVDKKTIQYIVEQAKFKQAQSIIFKPKVDHYRNAHIKITKGQ